MSWNRAKRDKHYPERLVRSGQVMAQSKELTRERETLVTSVQRQVELAAARTAPAQGMFEMPGGRT